MNARRFWPKAEVDSVAMANMRQQNTTPNLGAGLRVSGIRKKYPWFTANQAWAFAKSGLDADSPVVAQAAVAQQRRAKKKRDEKKGGGGFFGGVGRVAGAVTGGAGDVIGVAGRGVASAGKTVISETGETLEMGKTLVRGAATIAQSGAEVVDAYTRDIARETHEEGVLAGLGRAAQLASGPVSSATRDVANEQPTSAGVALRRVLSGQDSGLGKGYFPKGEATAEAARRGRAVYSVDGKAGTLGRIGARVVFEPGSKPYDALSGTVDAAMEIWTDPAGVTLSAVGKARRARKLFEAAGGVAGRRSTALPERVAQFMESRPYAKLRDWLATENNTNLIRQRFKNKLDVDTLVRLRDAASPEEVDGIMKPLFGGTLLEKPTSVVPTGLRTARDPRGVRLLNLMPKQKLLLDKPEDSLENFHRALVNAKVPLKTIDTRVDQLAQNFADNDIPAIFDTVTGAYDDIAAGLRDNNIPEHVVKQATGLFTDRIQGMRAYFGDTITRDGRPINTIIDGLEVDSGSPHTIVELLNRSIALPDHRDMRKVTSRLGALQTKLENGHKAGRVLAAAPRISNAGMNFITEQAFKPLVLMRLAWPVRVIGEEQVRMAGAGLSSAFRHPVSYIAYAMGSDKKVFGKTILRSRGDVSAAGDEIEEAHQWLASLSQRGGAYRNRPGLSGHMLIGKNHADFSGAWADGFAAMSRDPILKRIAGGFSPNDAVPGGLTGQHIDDVKRWGWDGAGREFREQLSDRLDDLGDMATDQTAWNNYVDMVGGLVHEWSGGSDELMQAVASGKWGGKDIAGGIKLNNKFVDRLQEVIDIAPQQIKADQALGRVARSGYDRFVDAMFSGLMSRPTNYLSRSPAFKQFYWKHVEQMMGGADEAAQTAILMNAKKANLSRGELRRLAERKISGAGELTLDELDELAKGHALDSTQKLLYDLSDRSQFFDATRTIFPFGEAWKEVGTTWARLIKQNPAIPRRAQQVIQGARGSGFFYTDEQTGVEMFNYPLTGELTEAFIDVPVPMRGAVGSLNVFSSNPFLPGVGPVWQWGAGEFLPDKPEWKFARDLILPFGEVQTEGGVVEAALIPSWAQKIRQAGFSPFGKQDDLRFNSTVADTMRFLATTGKYDLQNEDDVLKLEKDAVSKAKLIYLARGLSQFVAPAAPSPQFVALDKDGHKTVAFLLTKELQAMQKKANEDGDPDRATREFLDKFGENAVLFLQPKTEGKFMASEEAERFVQQHPDLVRKYPDTYAYFVTADPDEFDFDAYNRQIRRGERVAVPYKEIVERANDRLGNLAYNQYEKKIEGRTDKAASQWLAEKREELIKRYPGYKPYKFTSGETEEKVRQIEKAINEPVLRDTPTGEAIGRYLDYRAKAVSAAKRAGVKINTAKRTRPLRDWLREKANTIIADEPSFQLVWDRVFSHELKQDDEED